MIKRAVGVILRSLGLIILSACIFAVAAGITSTFIPIDYVTQSQLMVNTYDNETEKVLDEYMIANELAKTFTYIAQTNPVLNLVNEKLGTDYSMSVFESKAITVKNASGIITITVTHKDPVQAKLIADAMAEALVRYVQESIFPGQNLIRVINNAYEPQKPGIMYYLLNAVKGGVGGGALATIIILALDIIRSPIKSESEVKTLLNLNTLGKIKHRKNFSFLDARIYKSEDFNFLRVNLRNNTDPEKDKIFAVISPCSREGKTFVIANLGANIAANDKKVLLIDGNLKNPDLTSFSGYDNEKGLTSYDGALIKETAAEGLYILPAGEKSTSSINSSKLSALLDELKKDFDYIFIDTPGALKHADTADILYYTDKAIIVAEYDKTSAHKIEKVCELAGISDSMAAGIVINKARKTKV